MIADMINKKKFNPILTELFLRDKKLNIFSKHSRLNSTHCFIMKILNKTAIKILGLKIL